MGTSDAAVRPREELIAQLQGEIRTLAREQNAVILAHNYERAEVQDVADYVGGGTHGLGQAADHRHGLQRASPGAARWTVRLIAEHAVQQKLVPQVGRETIRILLQRHDLKPWREKHVVRG